MLHSVIFCPANLLVIFIESAEIRESGRTEYILLLIIQ